MSRLQIEAKWMHLSAHTDATVFLCLDFGDFPALVGLAVRPHGNVAVQRFHSSLESRPIAVKSRAPHHERGGLDRKDWIFGIGIFGIWPATHASRHPRSAARRGASDADRRERHDAGLDALSAEQESEELAPASLLAHLLSAPTILGSPARQKIDTVTNAVHQKYPEVSSRYGLTAAQGERARARGFESRPATPR